MKRSSVTIVGGGVIGASVAYNLASNGVKDVAILERSMAGSGSTSASFGGFRSQFSNELSIRLSQMSIRVIERFEKLTGYDPLVSRDGYVFVASSEHSLERLKKDQMLQRSMGVPVELLDQEELQSSYPFYRFNGILGGNRCMADGHASTMAVEQGYITAGKRMGVKIYEHTEATGIRKVAKGRFEVETTAGLLSSDAVVIAAGAYSSLVGKLASVKIPIEPLPRKVLVTHNFADGIPERIPLIIDVDTTFAFGREGRGLIFGTNPPNTASFDLVFPPNYDNDVMAKAVERVPASMNCSLSRSVAGLYEMTPDANPIVCEMPEVEGLYCCAGFAGHGFMHSPAIGELFAELLTTGKTSLDISSFHIARFKRAPTDRESRIV